MVSRFLVGKDGLTAYERRRGRKCRILVVAFGEKDKEIRPGKERANKLETRRNARGTSTYRGMPQEDRGGDDGRRDGPQQEGGG